MRAPFSLALAVKSTLPLPARHARRPATRSTEAPAAFARGGAVGAGRAPARQRGGRPRRRRRVRRRLLQRRPPDHLPADRAAGRRRQAGRRRHRVRSACLGAEARLRRRARVPRCTRRQRPDRREHPALRADRPRPLDPAAARGDGRRHRRQRLQPDGARRQGNPRPGRGQGAAHRRAGESRRAAVLRDRQAPGRRRRAHRDALQPRRSRPTSPACPPASPTSTG